MGEGPIPATKLALKKGGFTLDQMDRHREQRGFAAQAIAVSRGLELDPKKTNPNGGAIALGHPIAARAPSWPPRRCTSCTAAAAATRWSPCASAAARASPPSSSGCDAPGRGLRLRRGRTRN